MGKKNRFKKGLVTQVRKDIEWEKNQEELKNKYQLKKDVVIVEKTNMVKFLIRMFIRLIRMIAIIIWLVLSVIGLLSLVYPETRKGLLDIYFQTLLQLHSFTGI